MALETSALDVYASRDGSLADFNLCQFVSNYHTVKGKVMKHLAPEVRIFPSLLSKLQSELYNEYCKYQLIKYRPWITTPSNAWQQSDRQNDNFVAAYTRYLQTDEARQYISNYVQELDHAQ